MTSKVRSNNQPPPWNQGDDGEASFGLWLRRQREARQISLREIADASKISLRYLEAFEQDRFDVLPAAVFTRGFLREYARYVGLDPDEVVNHFLGAQQAAAPETVPEEPATSSATSPHWGFGMLWVLAGAAVLALVALISFHNERSRRQDERRQASAATEAPSESAVAAAQPIATEPTENVRPASSPAPANEPPPALDEAVPEDATDAAAPAAAEPEGPLPPLRVTLDFTEDCWIEIAVDGRRRIQELRVPGESLTIDAERSVVLQNVGNAGGVVVRVNGRRLELGEERQGRLRRPVRIDLETAQALASGG